MFYSDDETRKKEEFFQQQLKAAREYIRKNKEYIDERMTFMSTVLIPILQKEYKTKEEVDLLLSSEKEMKELGETLKAASDLLGESLERQSVSFYNSIKERALSGDAEANEIYLDLKPLYDGLIESKISKN